MFIVRGVVVVDGIELAASGQLKAVEVALGGVSDQQVVAAVLLQADADAKSCHDLASAIILCQIIGYVVVVRRSRHQDSVVIMIRPVSSYLVIRSIPKGEPKGVRGEDIILNNAIVRLFKEYAGVGVVNNAVIIKHDIPRPNNLKPVFFAARNAAGSNLNLATLQDRGPRIAAIHGRILQDQVPHILRRNCHLRSKDAAIFYRYAVAPHNDCRIGLIEASSRRSSGILHVVIKFGSGVLTYAFYAKSRDCDAIAGHYYSRFLQSRRENGAALSLNG